MRSINGINLNKVTSVVKPIMYDLREPKALYGPWASLSSFNTYINDYIAEEYSDRDEIGVITVGIIHDNKVVEYWNPDGSVNFVEKTNTGKAGWCGARGICGMRGLMGACGPRGWCGTSGLSGNKGWCGNKGDSGIKGWCGASGVRGPQGYCGAAAMSEQQLINHIKDILQEYYVINSDNYQCINIVSSTSGANLTVKFISDSEEIQL